jgi:hypothetical protein
MSVANRHVIAAWKNGEKAVSGRKCFRTDGIRLYSYQLLIGINVNGTLHVGDFTAPSGAFYSMTTSKHVGMARRVANEVFHPAVFRLLSDDLARAAKK